MPRRRCVGCGRIAPKSELLRIAATKQQSADGGGRTARIAVVDRDGTMPGRGAYLCSLGSPDAPTLPDAACLERATRRGGIARALRAAVTLDPKIVESVCMSVAKPDEGRLAETGIRAEGACHPASVGPLAISKS